MTDKTTIDDLSAEQAYATGRAVGSALACLSRRSRSLFARGDGDLPLLKLVKSTMLAAKSPVPGECRVKQVLVPATSNLAEKKDEL